MAKAQFSNDYLELFPPDILAITEGILKEARQTIDELREQNILMRKVMVLIDNHSVDYKPHDIRGSCAWCGYSDEVHDSSCLILAIRILLPTIPEIK